MLPNFTENAVGLTLTSFMPQDMKIGSILLHRAELFQETDEFGKLHRLSIPDNSTGVLDFYEVDGDIMDSRDRFTWLISLRLRGQRWQK
jgi:hypothetical protein